MTTAEKERRVVALGLYMAAIETVRAWDADDDDAFDDLENAIEWLREAATAAGKLRTEMSS